eukprot:scaffold109199_cov35-Tisochrysis_lutea.AAC.1
MASALFEAFVETSERRRVRTIREGDKIFLPNRFVRIDLCWVFVESNMSRGPMATRSRDAPSVSVAR